MRGGVDVGEAYMERTDYTLYYTHSSLVRLYLLNAKVISYIRLSNKMRNGF